MLPLEAGERRRPQTVTSAGPRFAAANDSFTGCTRRHDAIVGERLEPHAVGEHERLLELVVPFCARRKSIS